MEEEEGDGAYKAFLRDYLKIQDAKGRVLAEMQTLTGGSNQGTVVLAECPDGNSIMIEQQTSNAMAQVAENVGASYIKQKRKSGFHAEMRLIRYLRHDLGLDPAAIRGTQVWVSKPICALCARKLREYGCVLNTQDDHTVYENWVDPDTMTVSTTIDDANYVIRHRQTEAQRLKNEWPKDMKL